MTSKVTIYHIPSSAIVNSPYTSDCCVNIVDTPGFGDTRGDKWDEQISNMIAQLLTTITALDYILIVAKANESRLSLQTKYVYNSIQNLYAIDISERVLGMYTFSDGHNDPLARVAV